MTGYVGEQSEVIQQRWLDCQNTGSTSINAWAPVQTSGVTVNADGKAIVQVANVTTANTPYWGINGATAIPAGGWGQMTIQSPMIAAYDPASSITHGSSWGIGTGGYLTASGTRFVAVGQVDATKHLGLFYASRGGTADTAKASYSMDLSGTISSSSTVVPISAVIATSGSSDIAEDLVNNWVTVKGGSLSIHYSVTFGTPTGNGTVDAGIYYSSGILHTGSLVSEAAFVDSGASYGPITISRTVCLGAGLGSGVDIQLKVSSTCSADGVSGVLTIWK